MRSGTDSTKRKISRQGAHLQSADPHRVFISAIENKEVVSFVYNGEQRTVEPQTYGVTTTGNRVLRARQIGGGSRSGQSQIAKLFDLKKISALRKTGVHFERALPEHNPNDSAMAEIFASLPRA